MGQTHSPVAGNYPVPTCPNMPMIINDARKKCPKNRANVAFDKDGLAYNEFMMKAQRRKFQKTRDVKQMALYADVVTNVFPDWAGNDALEACSNVTDPAQLDTTAIANAAYISLYARCPELRKIYV